MGKAAPSEINLTEKFFRSDGSPGRASARFFFRSKETTDLVFKLKKG